MITPAHWLLVTLTGLTGLAIGAQAEVAEDDAPTLDRETLEGWRRYLSPTAEDQEWLEIGWLPELGEAIRVAQDPPRPILLWAMNGHPLACT